MIEKSRKKEIIDKANELISKYDIKEPFIDVFNIAKREGIKLRFVKMPERLKDVAGFLDINEKIIFINKDDPANKQTFTVAHELGHYILEHEAETLGVLLRYPLMNNENDIEIEADCFATNLLVPKEMFNKKIKRYQLDDDDVIVLSNLFGVSKEVIEYRVKNIK